MLFETSPAHGDFKFGFDADSFAANCAATNECLGLFFEAFELSEFGGSLRGSHPKAGC